MEARHQMVDGQVSENSRQYGAAATGSTHDGALVAIDGRSCWQERRMLLHEHSTFWVLWYCGTVYMWSKGRTHTVPIALSTSRIATLKYSSATVAHSEL